MSNESASSVERDPSDYDIRQTFSGAIPYRLVAKSGPAMSVYSQKQVMRFCARRGSRICMITLLVCGSMLTSVAFGREHILLGFDSLVLNGIDIPSGCFDLLITKSR